MKLFKVLRCLLSNFRWGFFWLVTFSPSRAAKQSLFPISLLAVSDSRIKISTFQEERVGVYGRCSFNQNEVTGPGHSHNPRFNLEVLLRDAFKGELAADVLPRWRTPSGCPWRPGWFPPPADTQHRAALTCRLKQSFALPKASCCHGSEQLLASVHLQWGSRGVWLSSEHPR